MVASQFWTINISYLKFSICFINNQFKCKVNIKEPILYRFQTPIEKFITNILL